jgi:hypothetical protein
MYYQVPVNAKIWQSIASTRVLPQISPIISSGMHCGPTDPPGFTYFSPDPFNPSGQAVSQKILLHKASLKNVHNFRLCHLHLSAIIHEI